MAKHTPTHLDKIARDFQKQNERIFSREVNGATSVGVP